MADWNSPIFGCFSDCKLCLLTWCLPCFGTGKTSEALGMDSCIWGAVAMYIPFYNCYYMKKQRDTIIQKQGIEDEGCSGWIWICCFPLCTIIQHQKEMGVNPLSMGEEIERV